MLMVEGAVIALVSVLLGRFLPSRRRTPKPLPPPKPVCGCGHHRSFHPDGGKCNDKGYAGNGVYGCGCKEYVGPQPLPEYYAPEIGA